MYEAPHQEGAWHVPGTERSQGSPVQPARGRGVRGSWPSPGPKAQPFLCVYSECLYLSHFHAALFGAILPSLCPRPLSAHPKAPSNIPLSVLWVHCPWPTLALFSHRWSLSFPLCFLCLRMNFDARGCGCGISWPRRLSVLWGFSSYWGSQKRGHSRSFPAQAAPASARLLCTSAPHPQPTVLAAGCQTNRARGLQRSQPAPPALGKMVHEAPAFPSQAPCCRDLANFLSGWGS